MANITKKTGGPIIEDVTDTSSIDNLTENQMKLLLQKLLSQSLAKPVATAAAATATVKEVSDTSSATVTTTTPDLPPVPVPAEDNVTLGPGSGEEQIKEILQTYVSVIRGEDGVPQVFVGELVLPKIFPSNIFSSSGSAGAFKDGPALVVSVKPGVHMKEENRLAALNHDPVKDVTLAYSDGDQVLFCEWDSRLLKSVTRSSFSTASSSSSSSSSSDAVADPNAPSATLQAFIDDEKNLSRCIVGSTNIRARAGTTLINYVDANGEKVVMKRPWTVLGARQDTVDIVMMIFVGEAGKIMHVTTPRYKLCNSE